LLWFLILFSFSTSCALQGVCLHTSSSGLDLPMKVVDMFGSNLPVCAVKYDCLLELVKPGENGLMFNTSTELAEQLADLLIEPGHEARLAKLASGAAHFAETRWAAHWLERTAPRIRALAPPQRPWWLWALIVGLVSVFCWALLRR